VSSSRVLGTFLVVGGHAFGKELRRLVDNVFGLLEWFCPLAGYIVGDIGLIGFSRL